MANLDYFSDEDVISFTLLDQKTVDRLRREGDVKLPYKKVNIPKDERWNTKLMSSKLLQGILAGDSIPTMAKSLLSVVGYNAASAVRNARTMVTGAENRGRLDSYEELADKGVIQKKVWIATADDRTRESHLELDGEEVDIDKPFSNGLMYPADPSGDPSEVYNCRCSMRDHIVGFRRADGSISYVGTERDTTSHEARIEEERERRGIEPAESEEVTVVSDEYMTFDDVADMQTKIIGQFDFGDVHKEGHEVQYATEYKGDGSATTKFFSDNSNNTELIDSMSADEMKAFKDLWSKGKFMQGQQYGDFSDMKPKLQNATRVFDKYLDQTTIDQNIEVVRLSDAQLIFGAGNRTGSLEDFIAMEGQQVICNANMSFSAASEGLRINPTGSAPTVEYVLRVPAGSDGAGMYIGDDRINIWGDKQREFMTNRNIWMTVGHTEYDEARGVYRVEINYGGLMEHDYS